VTVSAASFLVAYPEFAPMHAEDATLIPAVLARAERRIGNVWREDLRDDAVELQCAHMLSLMPSGRNAKLSEPGKETAYQCALKELKSGNAFARYRIV
jgi:uncharacterized protein DUF4054